MQPEDPDGPANRAATNPFSALLDLSRDCGEGLMMKSPTTLRDASTSDFTCRVYRADGLGLGHQLGLFDTQLKPS